MRTRRPGWRGLGVIALLALASPVLAHDHPAQPILGVAIPSLEHGQMAVYARHWSAIVDMAATHPATRSEDFRRVLNYARIQKAWCLWGLAPRAIADEESPFNECSHAYLAAARSLLETMRRGAGYDAPAERLGQTVDRELVYAGAPVLCGFSGEEFDTASHVVPRWMDIPRHPPSLIPFAGAAVFMAGAAAATRRWLLPRA